jgi:hypothetical protein
MATEYSATFTGTPGVAVTAGNAGSARPFDTLTPGLVFAQDPQGNVGVTATTTGLNAAWDLTGAGTKVLMRCMIRMEDLLTGADRIIMGPGHLTTGYGVRDIVNSIGRLRLQIIGTSGVDASPPTDPSDPPLDTRIRLVLFADPGTSTTTGSTRTAAYLGPTSSTPFWDSGLQTGKDTAASEGTYRVARWAFDPAIITYAPSVRFGSDVGWDTYPYAAPAPTINLVSSDVYRVDARTSVRGGTGVPLTYSLSWVSGPNNLGTVDEPVDGVFLIPKAATASVYRVTATQDDAPFTKDVTVPAIATGGAGPGGVEVMWCDGTTWENPT